MLRKKPGHGRRRADDDDDDDNVDDAPILPPPRHSPPSAAPRRRLARRPRLVTVIIFFLFFFLFAHLLTFSHRRQSPLPVLAVLPRCSSLLLRHLLFFCIYLLPPGTTTLHRIFSRSHLLLAAERRRFKRASPRLSANSSVVTNTVIFTYRVLRELLQTRDKISIVGPPVHSMSLTLEPKSGVTLGLAIRRLHFHF